MVPLSHSAKVLTGDASNYFDTNFNSNKYSLIEVKIWQDKNNYVFKQYAKLLENLQ